MNTKRKTFLHYAVVSLLLNAACVMVGQSAQAQGPRRIPLTPEAQEAFHQGSLLARTAVVDLHAGRYVQAEAEARQSLSIDPIDLIAPEVLAAALDAQGKNQEALQQYQTVVEHYDRNPRNLLPYSLLLLKSGQWEQALSVYNQAASQYSYGNLKPADTHFSPDVPEPAALALAIHIERGRMYNAGCNWAGEAQNTEAVTEYQKALQLAPDNDLANYYYGVGWQKLSPAERAKFGTAAQARAALQKAVKIGKGDVKKAAQKALLVAMKPQ